MKSGKSNGHEKARRGRRLKSAKSAAAGRANTKTGAVRIIAGRWRRHRLPVPAVPGLRPTPDRVRETLFNWLGPGIRGMRCLDLFAGSGALGLEAASRGAAEVVLVEQNEAVVRGLVSAICALTAQAPWAASGDAKAVAPPPGRNRAFHFPGPPEITLVRSHALDYLQGVRRRFDVIFLDPPFDSGLLEQVFRALHGGDCLAPGAILYLEMRRAAPWPALPTRWQITHDAAAGDVRYLLATHPEHDTMKITALYPGTFDPMTNGHVDLVQRASRLFHQVIVGVAQSTVKNTLLSLEERIALANIALASIPNARVCEFGGLLSDFARESKAQILLRGVRSLSDFENEFQRVHVNRILGAGLDTIFMAPGEGLGHVSSSLVREIILAGGDPGQFVPPAVQAALAKKREKAEFTRSK